jgi:UDP-N-acetylglucosamine/UDP-N-acetylgalactosamine diphosphorylase
MLAEGRMVACALTATRCTLASFWVQKLLVSSGFHIHLLLANIATTTARHDRSQTSTMETELREKFSNAGQDHLFKYWDQLSESQQSAFLKQLSKLGDPEAFIRDVSNAIAYSSSVAESKVYTQLPQSSYTSTISSSKETLNEWETKGIELIKDGKVGIILMAGGQGTRLGSSLPKGCYDVGLPSHKSLFQIQVERIKKLEQLAGVEKSLTLYVMTSQPTRQPTEEFFQKHEYFGWDKEQIIFFNQGTLPAVDLEGQKLLLGQDKCSLAESPDGNGGLYKALFDNGILDSFKEKGIEHIHMYCIDNILVKVGDPTFMGFSVLNGFDVATKVVRKNDPAEKVGLIVLDKKANKPCVIEYSEISQKLSEAKDETDPSLLKLRAANIVNHYYNVDFLQRMVPQWIKSRKNLPYHIAKKKIACTDINTGEPIKPTENNGIKMEQFIFDVFPSVDLEKFGCLEVAREDEFSPLKNAPGSVIDSPEMCRANCLKRSTRWIIENGGLLESADALVEVSPLTSYFGEGLSGVADQTFAADTVL